MKKFIGIFALSLLVVGEVIAMRCETLPISTVADLKNAAQAGDIQARYMLGVYHFEGRPEIERSIEKAKFWYEKAAEQGHLDAQYNLARIYEKEKAYDRAMVLYKKSASQGNILAQFKLAQLYERKDCPSHSYAKAIEFYKQVVQTELNRADADEAYKKAVRQAQAQAAYMLGGHALGTPELPANFADAKAHYERALAIEPTHARALYGLAMLYANGKGDIPRDIKKARELLQRAAAQDFAQAYTRLGSLAQNEGEYADAVMCYEKAVALKNDAEALHALGLLYEKGIYTEKSSDGAVVQVQNKSKAQEYYHKSASQGYKPALDSLMELAETSGAVAYLVGLLFENGQGVSKNEELALYYYRNACQLSYMPALERLKVLARTSAAACCICAELFVGSGHPEEALIYFYRSAEQGNSSALQKMKELAQGTPIAATASRLLGSMYLQGRGVPKDIKVAIEWFFKAALLNDAEAEYLLGMCNVRGEGIPRNVELAIDWFEKAANRNYQLAVEALRELAAEQAIAAYCMGQLYENGRGIPKNLEAAITWYRKASQKGLAKAFYALARICENRPIIAFASAKDVFACYQETIELYKKAGTYQDAPEAIDRIVAALNFLRELREPDFKNFAFIKLTSLLSSTDVSPDVLYCYAHICERVRGRCSELIQAMVVTALLQLAKQFPKYSSQMRAILKVIIQLIETEDFSACPLDAKEEEYRVFELYRICKGIWLMSQVDKTFEIIGDRQLKIAPDAVADMRIDTFNCLFRDIQKESNDDDYKRSVDAIMRMFKEGQQQRLMTQDMLRDREWNVIGTDRTLLQLLRHHTTHRFKNRIIFIARILASFDASTRANILASWAAAGHHCSTRAEEETYKFYVLNATDARSLEQAESGLGMRLAICLAELRKNCLDQLVPADTFERIHQIAHLEGKVGRLLSFAGDAEKFRDEYASMVVLKAYKELKPQEIKEAVLRLYTVENMVNYIISEANKIQGSRIPYSAISEYFAKIPHGLEVLQQLYDEDGKLTSAGARLLLYHFGYLE